MSLLFKWLESLSIDVTIMEQCSRQRSTKSTCSACKDCCEPAAITISERTVTVDTSKCNSCGACFSACPVSAITGAMPKRDVQNGLLVYEPHYCPTVKEMLIYRRKGIKGILVPKDWKSERWQLIINETNAILEKINLLTPLIVQEQAHEEPAMTRRELFTSTKKKGETLAKEMTPASWRVNSDGWSLPVIYPEIQFYHVGFDTEKCTLCGGCFALCSQAALVKTNSEVIIDHQKCTDCSLCEDICPEDALYVKSMIGEKTKTKLPIEDSTCKRCKRKFLRFEDSESERCHACANAGENWLLP